MSVPSCAFSPDDIPRRLVHSPRQPGVLLGLSHASVYRLIGSGKLKTIKIGSRTGILRSSIDALIAEAE
jgi:predicted DNA-binding transcriptional regulator AlpA